MAWAARPEESKTGRPQHRLAASDPANGCPKAIKAHACRVPAAQVATTDREADRHRADSSADAGAIASLKRSATLTIKR